MKYENLTKTKNNLISYPRSGSNWIRYCMEYLTGKPTHGKDAKLYPNNKPEDLILRRWHNRPDLEPDDKIVYLIRDYRELIFRREHSIDKTIKQLITLYNEMFDRYDKSILIIYYEDLLDSFEPIEKIFNHYDIEISKEKLDDFKLNLEEHRKKSISFFKRKEDRMSDSKTKNFYQRMVSEEEIKDIDYIFKKVMGDNFKFLEHYEVDKNKLKNG